MLENSPAISRARLLFNGAFPAEGIAQRQKTRWLSELEWIGQENAMMPFKNMSAISWREHSLRTAGVPDATQTKYTRYWFTFRLEWASIFIHLIDTFKSRVYAYFRMGHHVRNAYRIQVRKPEVKRPLGRQRLRRKTSLIRSNWGEGGGKCRLN
jgi:hypothetical protein